MTKMKELKGHTSRVLHLATSPDGSMVCSAAADETLRFWNVFAAEGKSFNEEEENVHIVYIIDLYWICSVPKATFVALQFEY